MFIRPQVMHVHLKVQEALLRIVSAHGERGLPLFSAVWGEGTYGQRREGSEPMR